MEFVGFFKVNYFGGNGVGAITVNGVKQGDILVKIYPSSLSGYPDYGSSFTAEVIEDGEVNQTSAGDYSSMEFSALVLRGVP